MSAHEASRDILRILDANLNRAREAARVVEEQARFAIKDPPLFRRLKAIREGLAAIASSIGEARLLAARDTPNDFGTDVTSSAELSRAAISNVLTANLKRLQEALRVMEEYAKLGFLEASAQAKKLRYEAYVLENDFAAGAIRARLRACSVMLILTRSLCRTGWQTVLRGAINAGVRCIQVREKDALSSDLVTIARETLIVARDADHRSLVIVNDRFDVAQITRADGVHLGTSDLPIAETRRLAGTGMLVGASTHNEQEVSAALAAGADYLGAGAMFTTSTKQVQHLGGPAFGALATRTAGETPVFCIGGVTLANAADLKKAGISRVAVSSAICGAEDPSRAAAELVGVFGSTS